MSATARTTATASWVKQGAAATMQARCPYVARQTAPTHSRVQAGKSSSLRRHRLPCRGSSPGTHECALRRRCAVGCAASCVRLGVIPGEQTVLPELPAVPKPRTDHAIDVRGFHGLGRRNYLRDVMCARRLLWWRLHVAAPALAVGPLPLHGTLPERAHGPVIRWLTGA